MGTHHFLLGCVCVSEFVYACLCVCVCVCVWERGAAYVHMCVWMWRDQVCYLCRVPALPDHHVWWFCVFIISPHPCTLILVCWGILPSLWALRRRCVKVRGGPPEPLESTAAIFGACWVGANLTSCVGIAQVWCFQNHCWFSVCVRACVCVDAIFFVFPGDLHLNLLCALRGSSQGV